MKLKVWRKWPKKGYCIGIFYVSGARLSNSLEDEDRGLDQKMPTGKINQLKIKGRTAIPKGTYRVVLSVSPKFSTRAWAKKYKGLVPELLNVKGYSGVRIHPANSASEVEGCIAPGDNTVIGKVTNSTKRYYELMDKLVPAWEKGEEITIEIV
jgi:hypothetical protein